MLSGALRLGNRLLLLGLLLALLVVAAVVWEINSRRDFAYAEARRETDRLSLAMAEHSGRTFEAADLVLRGIAEEIRTYGIDSPQDLARYMSTPVAHQLLRDLIVGHIEIDGVSLIGADGTLLNTSRLWPVPQVKVSDRNYFRVLRDAQSNKSFVSEPIIYRSDGTPTFFLARRLTSLDGRFIGIALGAMQISYLESVYRDVAGDKHTSISLRRSDGLLLARFPSRAMGPDAAEDFGDPEMLRQITDGAELSRSLTVSRRDEIRRLRSARVLKDFPLIVAVGRDVAAIDKPWHQVALAVGGGGGLLALVIGCGTMLLARQVSRREASETMLSATLEHMSQGIMMVDKERRVVVCNSRAMAMLDLPPALMAERPYFAEIVRHQRLAGEFGPDGTGLDETMRRLLRADGKGFEGGLAFEGGWGLDRDVYERRRPNGTILEIRGTMLPDGGVVRSYTDVTAAREREAALEAALRERDVAEAALRAHRDDLEREVEARTQALAATEARLREAIHTIPEGFVLFDAADRLVLCNAAYREIYGFSEAVAASGASFEALVRDTVLRGLILPEIDIEAVVRDRVAEHHAVTDAHRCLELQLADGRWIESHERRTGDGGIVGLRIDVTEARRREAVEGERQKMAALGQLAGGVAHEINNLLQPALTLPAMVRERLPPDDLESREDLDVVIEDIRRAREIVRSILQYARKEEPVLVPLDLADEVCAAIGFVRGLLPPGLTLYEEEVCNLGHVIANKTQLAQVLTNLVVNAGHATDGQGEIRIILDEAFPDAREAEALGIAPGRRYLTIAVADDGCGMDAATQARIFEPFFTTKPIGQGTGLGLSVVYGILRSWEGAIAVESGPGQGTTFTLYVPALEPVAPSAARVA